MIKINFFRAEFDNTIDVLTDYQNTMENQLKEVQNKEKINIANQIQTIEEDEIRGSYANMLEEEYDYIYELMFPRSLRYSFIVLLFLNLESLLNNFCDKIKNKNHLTIGAKVLKGDSIERSRIYLHKIAGISEIEPTVWEKIEDLSKVRNCIVHTMGNVVLSKDQKRLKDIVTHNKGLTISNSNHEEIYLILTDEYCKSSLSEVSNLIKELFEKSGI